MIFLILLMTGMTCLVVAWRTSSAHKVRQDWLIFAGVILLIGAFVFWLGPMTEKEYPEHK